jgi:hypothetical protein
LIGADEFCIGQYVALHCDLRFRRPPAPGIEVPWGGSSKTDHMDYLPPDPANPAIVNKTDVRNRTSNRQGIAGYLDDYLVQSTSNLLELQF